MTRRLSLLLAAFAVASALPDASRGESLAVLDVARVFEQYEMTRDLERLFDEQRRALAAEADKRRESMDQMRRALAAFDPASEDFARREQELVKAEVDFQVWSTYEERRLKNNHKNWLMHIYRNTQSVVADVAKSRGFDLVITYDRLADDAPDSTTLRQQILLQKVIYHSDRVDITEDVLKKLNSAYQARGSIRSLSEAPARPATTATTPVEKVAPTP